MASSYGKRTPLSLETKLEVLEALKYKSKIDVSREFGIGYSTVKKIKQREFEIQGKSGGSSNLLRKRNRQSPNEEVGDALITWFHQMKKQNMPINGPIMLDKAKELALYLGYEDFRPSHGWLERLKARNNIRFQKPFANKQSACSSSSSNGSSSNVEAAGGWIKNVLPKMIEGYDPKNIFNAAESALFYKIAPAILTGNHIQNGATVKDRLTVLFLCNSTGTEKHAFAVGKISNPSCFDTEGTPLPYYSSADALMTDFIWRDILQKLDQNLGKRKIVLFVDNVACHKIKLKLKNIKIALMPAESSPVQPLKRGVIRAVKIRYRGQLLKKMISASNNGVLVADFSKSIDLLNTLRMLETAWSSISPALFVDCFQKAGFYGDDAYCLEEVPRQSTQESEMRELLQEEFEQFIECDRDIDCFESPNTKDSKIDYFEIPTTNSKSDTVAPNKQETTTGDGFIDNVEHRVSHEEALDALAVVRRYLDENFTEYNAYYEVEEMIRLSAYANSTGNELMDSFPFDC